ncbi:MAG: hypothetical protein SGI74_00330 [Oligoflexia bacterium]|nr:hypothetical protein [Oligoflexia bacterium]
MAKNLSIRKVPPELERAIQQEAKKHKTTKTEVVLKALKEAFHLEKAAAKVQRDIRKFFGKMTPQEYQEFQKNTHDFSTIDVEMWK